MPSLLKLLEQNFVQKYVFPLELLKKEILNLSFEEYNKKNCILLFAIYWEKDPLLSPLK